jgi:superfamily II DNA or RNA helicase
VRVRILTPTKARIEAASDREMLALRKALAYKDKSAEFLYNKVRTNKWLKNNKPDEYAARLEELKAQIPRSLLVDNVYASPAVLGHLRKDIPFEVVADCREYPPLTPIEWANPFPYTPHPEQTLTVEELLAVRHGSAELCTGFGKSYVIMELARRVGDKVVVITPSASIWRELYDAFCHHFGEVNVGSYCGEKKVLGRRFTISVSNSVSNLEPGSEAWDFFQTLHAVIGDESHTFPAETLERMCNVVLGHVPYRFFLSGTQTDPYGGLTINNIIGPCVRRLTTREGIALGYLCPVEFRVVTVPTSNPSYKVRDASKMKRAHFSENANIARWIAQFANSVWELRKESTLVLVNEMCQISMLLRLLRVPHTYVHGNTISKKEMEQYGLRKVDGQLEVDRFNRGEVRVLIGTSSISTGTNIYPTHNTVNWQGGASEIATRQGAIGRSVRKLEVSRFAGLHAPKPVSKCWDFDVTDVPGGREPARGEEREVDMLGRHLQLRMGWYSDTTDRVWRV